MADNGVIDEVVACTESATIPRLVIGITHPQTCLVLRGRLRALQKAGLAVTLVAGPGELLDAAGRSEGVATVGIRIERGLAPLQDLFSLVRLWRLLRRIRPDAAEFSTPKAGLLGMLAAWIAHVPHRVYLLRGLKLETSSGCERMLLWVAEWLACTCAETVLCTSPSVREKALRLRIAKSGKLRVLGEGSSVGVDIDRFSPGSSGVREHFGIPIKAPVIGFVGRMTRDKGLPELVAAFETILSEVSRAWLLLVGWFDEAEDALDAELRQRILQHPRFAYTGFVDDTAPYYRAMDMMILPTKREGFPNVVLEASASGIPVVTTLATGSRDAVVPEATGLLVPPECPAAIVEAAIRLLRDEQLRLRMGAAGRTWVATHFSRERVLGLNVDFYRQLVGLAVPGESAEPATMGPFARRPWPEARPGHRAAVAAYVPQSGWHGESFRE